MKPNIFSYIRNQKKLVRIVIFFISWSQVYGYGYANYFNRKGNESEKAYHPSFEDNNSGNVIKSKSPTVSSSEKNEELNSVISSNNEIIATEPSLSNNPVSSVYFNSDIKEGVIGKDKDHPVDQVYDNIFNIMVDELPNVGSVTLEYDLFGVSDYSGISKVINDERFSGGLSTQNNQTWTHQSEPVNSGTLVKGLNTVLFTISPEANYTYRVKNVHFKITPSKNVRAFDYASKQLASGTVTKEFFKDQSQSFSIGNAGLETLAGSISQNTIFSITPLEILDIPAVAPEMVNVTSEKAGYRFLPHGEHFQTPAKVSLGFDKNKIPAGYTEKDIKTYFFNRELKKWIALEKDSLLSEKQVLVSKTTHFTDMINGIIKVPESPETGSYAPNSIKNIKAADPVSGIVSIAAPTPNNQGTVSTSFPIKLPAGRQGMQPSLSVNYSSDGGNGWMGMGWDLSIPAITIDTRWGVPRYDATKETEIYTIAGEQLTFKDGNNYVMPNRIEGFDKNRLPDGTQFYPRIEGAYNKIIRHGSSPSTYWWEVISKDGTKSYFGGDGTNVVENTVLRQPDTNNIGHWALYKMIDTNGNFTEYLYTKKTYTGTPGNGGQEFYIKTINYTRHNAAPTSYYTINFTNETGRKDVQINARLGFVQVIAERLKNIIVRLNKVSVIRSYDFAYEDGAFFKSLLKSITEKDANGQDFYTNKIEYNDNTQGGLFAGSSSVAIDNSIPKSTVLSNNKSKSQSIGLAATAGIVNNPKDMVPLYKNGTLGPNYQYSTGRSSGQTMLVDINGDGLADHIYAPDGSNSVNYVQNNATPSGNITFGGGGTHLFNSAAFSKSKSVTNSFGIEASAGSLINFNANAGLFSEKTITQNYMEDVNSDGILDIIDNGTVKFGYIDQGTVKYSDTSAITPNPILSGSYTATVDANEEKETRSQSPLLDVVKVWKAPYTGLINIEGDFTLDADSPDGINVMVQHAGTELKRSSLASWGTESFNIQNRKVQKGDYIYFRVSSVDDGAKDSSIVTGSITYTRLYRTNGTYVNVGFGALEVPYDENFNNAFYFDLEADYLHNSESGFAAPFSGTMMVAGTISKGDTSDIVNLIVSKKDVNGVVSNVYTQAYSTSATLQPLSIIVNVTEGETYDVTLSSPSGIDWTKVDINNLKASFTGTIDGQSVNSDLYPVLHRKFFNWAKKGDTTDVVFPAKPYIADQLSQAIPYLVLPNTSPANPFQGDILMTVKRYTLQGDLMDTANMTIPLNGYTASVFDGQVNGQVLTLPVLFPDVTYFTFINYYLESKDQLTRISEARFRNPSGALIPGNIFVPDNDNAVIDSGGTYITDKDNDGRFGPMYRNWGQFSYNGGWGNYNDPSNPHWDNQPIDESVLNIDTSDLNSGNTDPNNSTATPVYNKRWFQMQAYYGPDLEDSDSNIILRRYQGTKPNVYVDASKLGASRLGSDNVNEMLGGGSNSGSGHFAPLKVSKNKGTSGGGGIGLVVSGFGLSTGSSDTTNISNYIDLNGDGYPDALSSATAQYTNSIGGYSSTTGNINVNSSPYISSDHSKTNGFSAGNSYPIPFKTDSDSKTALRVAQAGFNIGGGSNTNEDSADYDFIDINGDGLPDKLFKNGHVALNLGYSFASPQDWGYGTDFRKGKATSESISAGASLGFALGKVLKNGSIAFGYNASDTGSQQLEQLIDINGDGLIDKIEGSTIRLNTGNGFVNYNAATLPFISKNKSIGQSLNFAVSVCPTIPISPTTAIKLCINPSYNNGSGYTNTTNQISDINGDGFPDLLTADEQNGSTLDYQLSTIGTTNLLRKVTLPTGGSWEVTYERKGNTYDMPQSRYVMTSVIVKDGFAQDDQFKPGVSKITVAYNNPYHSRRERTFYGFAQLRINQINTASGGANATVVYRYTLQNFNNSSYFLKGSLLDETLYDAAGKKWTETINTITARALSNTNLPIALPAYEAEKGLTNYAYFVTANKAVSNFYEGQATAGKSTYTESLQYDNYGNLKQYKDYGDQQIGSTQILTSEITYQINDSGSDYMILPTSVSSTATGVSRARTASYDVNGNLKTLTMAGGGNPEYKYDYDVYGNISKATLPQNANGETFWHTYTYDDNFFTYPVEVKDAFGYSSTTEYDLRFGVPIRTIDMNLQPTEYTYDAKGRLLTVTGPYELFNDIPWTIQMEYHPVTDAPIDATTAQSYAVTRHYDPEITGNTINTISIADGLGTAIQLKKSSVIYSENSIIEPVGDQYIVSGKVVQDAFGRALKSYYPTVQSVRFNSIPYSYTATLDNIEPTTSTYDVMDRVLTTKLPGEQLFSKVQYDFGNDRLGRTMFHTQFTDELGSIKHNYTDIGGRTTTVHEESNTGDIITSFTHDAIGQLLQVKDVEDNLTTSIYDDLGRRTSLTQPDNGTTTFTYDPAGNLTSKTTAENETVTYQYEYNRLKGITYPDFPENNVAYYYGEAQNASSEDDNAVGRLWYQTDATGTQRLRYGRLGELTSQRRSVAVANGQIYWFGTEWEYDTWNRVKTITYPDAEKVTYHYNKAGNLTAMDSEKDGFYKRYINQIGYDKFEQRVYLKYGNGTETNYEYETERRRLLKMQAKNTARTFMDNLYQYDVVSNVLQIHNNAAVAPAGLLGGATNYAYGYDDLYRLTSASGNWKGMDADANTLRHRYTYTMAYDNLNNIMSKVQKHETAPGNTGNSWTAVYNTSYRLNYKYEGTKPHAPSTIVDEPNIVPTTTCCDPNNPEVNFMNYSYDAKGNPLVIDKENCDVTEPKTTYIWDEENRLQAVDTNPSTPEVDGIALYTYDAGGERVIKNLTNTGFIFGNGSAEQRPRPGANHTYTVYPNGLLSMRLNRINTGGGYRWQKSYTKHYYAGSQRISGALGSSINIGKFNCDWQIIPLGSGGAPINEKDVALQKAQAAAAHGNAILQQFGINGSEYGQGGGYDEECTTDFSGEEEVDRYLYHPDHLGSSSFITGIDGEVNQNIEYFPSGETFVENHLNSYNTPYLYNSKELDDETGYLYYGARYYNPRVSLWLNVDPLASYDPMMNAEHYIDGEHNAGVYNQANLNPYIYTYNNPIIYVDPDGKQSKFWTRTWGGVQMVGGAVEAVVGGVGGVVTAETGVGAALGYVVLMNGVDNTVAGARQLWTGESTNTLLHTGTKAGAKALGASDQNAELIATGVDFSTILLGNGNGIKTASKLLTNTSKFEIAAQFGFKSYKVNRAAVLSKYGKNSGYEVHHLIEQRFSSLFNVKAEEMTSLVLTKAEHQSFTNAWRKAIGYNNDKNAVITTAKATKQDVINAAKKVYAKHPEILKALDIK
ncbi:SpvB/TcaC N-terminal domain-containing protein [Weeksellaceae bacterium A-14]